MSAEADQPPIQAANFDSPPPPPLELRQQGEPNQVIWECPGPSRVVDYPTTWHHLSDIPAFLVCTRCYERHIASTRHAGSFPRAPSEIKDGTCRFNVPRVTDSLWPGACQTGDLRPLKQYASQRLGMGACPGAVAGDANGQTTWYEALIWGGVDRTVNPKVCETCFEEKVSGTPFRGQFKPSAAAAHMGFTSGCSLHHPYLSRALAHCSKDPDNERGWSQFRAAARLRLSQPSCDGSPVGTGTRCWLRPRNTALGNTALIFCEACFLDQVGATPFGNEFEITFAARLPRNPIVDTIASSSSRTARLIAGVSSTVSNQDSTYCTCHGQIPSLLVLLDTCKLLQNFDLFLIHAPTILSPSTPLCTENGIISDSTSSWAEANSNPNFKICHACYTGIIAPYGSHLASLFHWESAAEPSPRVCSLHPTAQNPSFLQSMNALQRVLDTGLLSSFTSFLRSFVSTSPSPNPVITRDTSSIAETCPRAVLVTNHRWYGYQDCGICPSCYATVCAKTPLAPTMPIQNALVTGPTMCSMYSPRMRTLYAQACAKNDPAELIEFAHARALVHANTFLRAEALRQILDIHMMGAVHQGITVAAMYGAGGSFNMAAGGWNGHAYGNGGNLGWHPTLGGALAAQAGENMQMEFAEARGLEAEIIELEIRWLDFERE